MPFQVTEDQHLLVPKGHVERSRISLQPCISAGKCHHVLRCLLNFVAVWSSDKIRTTRMIRLVSAQDLLANNITLYFDVEKLPTMCSPPKRTQWREGLQHFRKDHGFSKKVLLNCCLVRRIVTWASPNAKGRRTTASWLQIRR